MLFQGNVNARQGIIIMHLQSYVCPSCLASRLGLGNVDHYSITGLLQGGSLDQCVFI